MRRELDIALRARATWVVASIAALLVGHGFVLAVDLFSSASRSALAQALQAKEMDPLLGVVRPTLGGVDLALALLAPLVAARTLSVEKERGSFGLLCLQVGSPARVVAQKLVSSLVGASLLLLPAVVCILLFRAAGGHVDPIETTVALLGEVLHLCVIVGASIAAAAWTTTFAQAATIAILISLSSWMLEAGEGFAALAWMTRAEAWSLERQIAPFHHGLVAIGSLVWLVIAAATFVVLALIGARFDWPLRRRALGSVAALVVSAALLASSLSIRRTYDWSEERRMSLPPAVVAALRAMPKPIRLTVFLDRDDSRRRQLESDVISKLRLARSDIDVVFPIDADAKTDRYGIIAIDVGGSVRETRSTSRRELMTLVLEAGGASSPDWSMPPYAGFPVVIDGARRKALAGVAYLASPLAFLAIGFFLSRRRSA